MIILKIILKKMLLKDKIINNRYKAK